MDYVRIFAAAMGLIAGGLFLATLALIVVADPTAAKMGTLPSVAGVGLALGLRFLFLVSRFRRWLPHAIRTNRRAPLAVVIAIQVLALVSV